MSAPRYSYPLPVVAGLVRDLLLLHKRDFHNDATACIESMTPPLNILGGEHTPQGGPCVITVNHYHREGFRAEWLALAVAAAVPVNLRWIMTAEFMYEGKWYRTIGSKASRILLSRIAQVYSFTNMPPMPPRERDVQERAASVRAVLEYVHRTADPVIAIAPEGHDPVGPEGILTRPAPGLGRFGLLLSKAGLKFYPVGVHEADGVLQVHFGQPYELQVSRDLSSDEKDLHSSRIIMKHIAELLPVQLRGEYV